MRQYAGICLICFLCKYILGAVALSNLRWITRLAAVRQLMLPANEYMTSRH